MTFFIKKERNIISILVSLRVISVYYYFITILNKKSRDMI